jgi:nucleotidyltransferase substrate binding protein (TIGR01987 family)
VPLDLTAFQSALAGLNRAVARSLAAPADEELRDAVIQRFEYTYELAWKSLRRYLEREGVDELATFSKRDLYREAAARGLVADPAAWFGYQIARNETSHTYNAGKAREVHGKAVTFAVDAEQLLAELDRRLGA